MSETTREKGSFREFGPRLWKRLLRPSEQVPYWTNFIVGIIVFGALGPLLEYFKIITGSSHTAAGSATNWTPAVVGLATYAAAVAGAAGTQMLIVESDKAYRGIAMLALAMVGLLCAPVLIGATTSTLGLHTLAVAATLIALWLWWLANADDWRQWRDDDPRQALGGATNEGSTEALPGDTSGFTV